VAGKSTVPVGTAARLSDLVCGKVPGALLAWNPEFLREGFAVEDTLHPERLVYGLPAGPEGRPPGRCWMRCTRPSSRSAPRR
jgi:UDPglucose 6-dehydrogenase